MRSEMTDGETRVQPRRRRRSRRRAARDDTAAATTQPDSKEFSPELPVDVLVSHVLREENLPDPADLAVLRAVSKGMRDAVDASGRLSFKARSESGRWAAERGYLTMVRYLHRRGLLDRVEYLCEAAARSGQLEELKRLRARRVPWDERTCSAAALGGHFDVLKWARKNKCPWDGSTCRSAAESEHFDILRWAYANGCFFDAQTSAALAKRGHFEMLMWAAEKAWDESVAFAAAEAGHFEMLKWLLEEGCPHNRSQESRYCALAAEFGNTEMLQWFRENDFW